MAQGLLLPSAMEMPGLFFDGCLITPLEVVFYTLIVTVLSLMRLSESCLINTFSFAYYWGFKSLLQNISVTSATSDHTIILYSVSGLMIFVLLHLSYLRGRQIDQSPEFPQSESLGIST